MAESNDRIEAIAEKIEAGERLNFDDGVELFERATRITNHSSGPVPPAAER